MILEPPEAGPLGQERRLFSLRQLAREAGFRMATRRPFGPCGAVSPRDRNGTYGRGFERPGDSPLLPSQHDRVQARVSIRIASERHPWLLEDQCEDVRIRYCGAAKNAGRKISTSKGVSAPIASYHPAGLPSRRIETFEDAWRRHVEVEDFPVCQPHLSAARRAACDSASRRR